MSIHPACKHEWTDANFNCPQCEIEDEVKTLRERVLELEGEVKTLRLERDFPE